MIKPRTYVDTVPLKPIQIFLLEAPPVEHLYGLQWENPEFQEAITQILYIPFTGMQPICMVTNVYRGYCRHSNGNLEFSVSRTGSIAL